MEIIIVCHTEFGFVSKNKDIIPDKNVVSGAREGVLNLIKLAKKFGAKITFAVCPEVVEFFPREINQEIGLHLHPDDLYIHPVECRKAAISPKAKLFNRVNSTVLKDYPYQEQFDMIKTSKEYLKEKFGKEPKVFVAGRWSLNNDTIKALVELGFTHDCSAPAHSKKPHYDWLKLPRICLPYYPSWEDYQKPGNLPLLIVPISQTLFGGTVNPEGVPLYGFAWLKACFKEYYQQGVPLFHICLHSPSMTDNYYLTIMERFLTFISKHKNINFKFVSEIKEYPQQKFKTKILPYILAINKELLNTAFKRILKRS